MFVITHKDFNFDLPKGYHKMLVGATQNTKVVSNKDDYLLDNTADNISIKNSSYCELTGIYWLWKNCDIKNIGISHYRRYFYDSKAGLIGKVKKYEELIQKNKLQPTSVKRLDELLQQYDWIVPPAVKIVDANVATEYIYAHYISDYYAMREAIRKLYPAYMDAFYNVMHQDRYYHFNMFYTSKKNFTDYCKWLFNILTEVENNIDITNYDPYQKRVFGFLAERLENVWLNYHNFKLYEMQIFETKDMDRNKIINKIKNKIK